MDAFSEVLSGVRLKGAIFFSAEFSAPWRLSTPHCRLLAPTLAPGAPHILIYHFVVEGSARVCLEGGPDVELSAGRYRGLCARGSPSPERRLRRNRSRERRDTPEGRDAGSVADARRRRRRYDAVRVRVFDV
jgi:hypothetical protein